MDFEDVSSPGVGIDTRLDPAAQVHVNDATQVQNIYVSLRYKKK